MRKGAGLTLVELMCAVALSVIIVGVIAFAVTQVQRSIEDLRLRTDGTTRVASAMSDLERDLAHMITDYNPPPAFANCVPAPVPLAMNSVTPAAQPGDPTGGTGLSRRADSIKIMTITPAGQRAYVEYCLNGATDIAPAFTPPTGGGLYVSQLMRHTLAIANPGDATSTLEPNFASYNPNTPMTLAGQTIASPVDLVDNVISFGLAYIPAGGTTFVPVANNQPANKFLPAGSVDVYNYTANAHGAADAQMLAQIPVGYPIELAINPVGAGTVSSWNAPSEFFTVRRWSQGAPPSVTQVMLSDHANIATTILPIPPATAPAQTVLARAFTPPAVIGVTIVLRYGLGPEASIVTLRREVPVSRS